MARRSPVQVTGADAIVANLYAFEHETREQFRILTRKNAQAIRDYAVQLAPKETGYMARNIKHELSPDELAFDVFLDPQDFEGHGLPFYPLYVEKGTSRQAAQPFMGPAFEWGRPKYEADIRAAIRYAQRKAGR